MSGGAFAILVTHGALGRELLATAESILGRQEDVLALSNTGRSASNLSEIVLQGLQGAEGRPVFLFVDLLGGSCGQACLKIRRARPDALVFSGVNLPMLLEFLHHRGHVSVEELKDRVLAKGRDGIRCLP